MEKMLILISLFFSALGVNEHNTKVFGNRPLFLFPTSCSITNVEVQNPGECDDNGTPEAFDDFFTVDILVEYTDPPQMGQLRIELGEDAIEGGGFLSIDVSDIPNTGSYLFETIRIKADGDPTEIPVSFSAEPTCRLVISDGPAVESCSVSASCTIHSATFSGISPCDNNGTGNLNDDFFTANLTINFSNPPSTGDLRIEPGGDALPGGGATSVPVTSLSGNTHTFTGVRFKADGNVTVAEIEFTSNTACVLTRTGPTVENCSAALACDIIDVQFSNIGTCNANGTPVDPSDDFFTANVLVEFANPPATGDLRIEPGGDALPGGGATSVPVASLVGSTHTFTGVRFKADGNITIAEVEFSADQACVFTKAGPTIGSCSFPVVCDLDITNVATTAETCPNASNGSIVITATTSTGPLTYAISGPVSQNNGTGVFSGLPDGAYTITVTDTGISNCTESSSAVVAAGADNAPPTIVCINKTVLLDVTGNYTLAPTDVFNAAASSDNCGTVNLTNISPASVGCAQAGQTVPVTVTVNDGNGNTASCTAQITVQEGTSLPVGLSGDNVGNANGSNTFQPCSGSEFTLTASGFSTSSSDVLRLVSRQLCGNGEIIARVVDTGGGGWAGITLRETKASGAKKVALKTQLSNNIRREIRSTANGAVNNLNFFRPQDTWLRLVRNGSNFSGYTSMDGLTWNFAFSTTISMTGCIIAGLFAESINTNVVTTAIFDQVTILGSAVPFSAPGTEQIAFELPDFQAYPNPTNGELALDFSSFRSQHVALEIHNMQGQLLKTLSFHPMEAPTERVNLSEFQNGVYLIVAKAEGWPAIAKRIVLMDE